MKARRQKVLTMDGMQSVGAIGKMRVWCICMRRRRGRFSGIKSTEQAWLCEAGAKMCDLCDAEKIHIARGTR